MCGFDSRVLLQVEESDRRQTGGKAAIADYLRVGRAAVGGEGDAHIFARCDVQGLAIEVRFQGLER